MQQGPALRSGVAVCRNSVPLPAAEPLRAAAAWLPAGGTHAATHCPATPWLSTSPPPTPPGPRRMRGLMRRWPSACAAGPAAAVPARKRPQQQQQQQQRQDSRAWDSRDAWDTPSTQVLGSLPPDLTILGCSPDSTPGLGPDLGLVGRAGPGVPTGTPLLARHQSPTLLRPSFQGSSGESGLVRSSSRVGNEAGSSTRAGTPTGRSSYRGQQPGRQRHASGASTDHHHSFARHAPPPHGSSHPAADLTRVISQARSLHQLSDIYSTHRSVLDPLHLAALLGRMPAAAGGSRPCVPDEFLPLADKLCALVTQQLDSYEPRQLSHMLWAMAKLQLGCRPPQAALIRCLLDRLLPPPHQQRHQRAANAMHAAPGAGAQPPWRRHSIPGAAPSSSARGRNSRQPQAEPRSRASVAGRQVLVAHGNAVDVAQTAWALARLAMDGMWAREAQDGSQGADGRGDSSAHRPGARKDGHVSPADRKGRGGSGVAAERLVGMVGSLMQAAEQCAPSMGPQELSNTVWAMAQLAHMLERAVGGGAAENDGVEDIQAEVEEEDEGGEEGAEHQGKQRPGAARSGLKEASSSPMFRPAPTGPMLPACIAPALLPLLRGCLRGPLGSRTLHLARSNALDRQHVPLLAWSAARLGYRDREMLEAVAGAAIGQVGSLTAHGVSLVLWSYASLGYHHPALLSWLSKAVLWKRRKMRCQTLSNTVWALAKFRLLDGNLRQRLATEVLWKLDELRPLSISTIAAAFASSSSSSSSSVPTSSSSSVPLSASPTSPTTTPSLAAAATLQRGLLPRPSPTGANQATPNITQPRDEQMPTLRAAAGDASGLRPTAGSASGPPSRWSDPSARGVAVAAGVHAGGAWSSVGAEDVTVWPHLMEVAVKQLDEFHPHTLLRLLSACGQARCSSLVLLLRSAPLLTLWASRGALSPTQLAVAAAVLCRGLQELRGRECQPSGPGPAAMGSLEHAAGSHAPAAPFMLSMGTHGHAGGSPAPAAQHTPSVQAAASLDSLKGVLHQGPGVGQVGQHRWAGAGAGVGQEHPRHAAAQPPGPGPIRPGPPPALVGEARMLAAEQQLWAAICCLCEGLAPHLCDLPGQQQAGLAEALGACLLAGPGTRCDDSMGAGASKDRVGDAQGAAGWMDGSGVAAFPQGRGWGAAGVAGAGPGSWGGNGSPTLPLPPAFLSALRQSLLKASGARRSSRSSSGGGGGGGTDHHTANRPAQMPVPPSTSTPGSHLLLTGHASSSGADVPPSTRPPLRSLPLPQWADLVWGATAVGALQPTDLPLLVAHAQHHLSVLAAQGMHSAQAPARCLARLAWALSQTLRLHREQSEAGQAAMHVRDWVAAERCAVQLLRLVVAQLPELDAASLVLVAQSVGALVCVQQQQPVHQQHQQPVHQQHQQPVTQQHQQHQQEARLHSQPPLTAQREGEQQGQPQQPLAYSSAAAEPGSLQRGRGQGEVRVLLEVGEAVMQEALWRLDRPPPALQQTLQQTHWGRAGIGAAGPGVSASVGAVGQVRGQGAGGGLGLWQLLGLMEGLRGYGAEGEVEAWRRLLHSSPAARALESACRRRFLAALGAQPSGRSLSATVHFADASRAGAAGLPRAAATMRCGSEVNPAGPWSTHLSGPPASYPTARPVSNTVRPLSPRLASVLKSFVASVQRG